MQPAWAVMVGRRSNDGSASLHRWYESLFSVGRAPLIGREEEFFCCLYRTGVILGKDNLSRDREGKDLSFCFPSTTGTEQTCSSQAVLLKLEYAAQQGAAGKAVQRWVNAGA